MIALKWFVLGVLLNIYASDGYRILAVFPLPGKSHGILGDNMVKHLLAAGHEVTYITPFVKKNANPKLQQIDVSDNVNIFNESLINVKMIMDKEIDYRDMDVVYNLLKNVAKNTLGIPIVQKFLRDPKQKFDVVICEYMFNELYSVFSAVFESPLIWFSTIEPHWIVSNIIDGPLNPAYSSDYRSSNTSPLSFSERVQELWTQIVGLYKQNFIYYYLEEEIYKELIVPILEEKRMPLPTYDEIKSHVSLMLGNTHVAIGEAVSLPQSYKHIGGYHVEEEVKPLPEDLKNILDNARNGVIYFSMGSNLKSKDLPNEVKRGILKVFGELKQTVIWKFEEVLPDTPKNVHIVKWTPQQSILAHPNVVVFVTHGGLLSLTETVHFGVPIISIPVFGDQYINAKRAEKKGFGKMVELTYTVHDDLKVALNEVISNPKYSENAKKFSVAYHNNPIKPKDALSFWVSHVVQTNGAHHLRSPAKLLPLYQRLYLDLGAIIIATILGLELIIKLILWKLRTNKAKKKEKRS